MPHGDLHAAVLNTNHAIYTGIVNLAIAAFVLRIFVLDNGPKGNLDAIRVCTDLTVPLCCCLPFLGLLWGWHVSLRHEFAVLRACPRCIGYQSRRSATRESVALQPCNVVPAATLTPYSAVVARGGHDEDAGDFVSPPRQHIADAPTSDGSFGTYVTHPLYDVRVPLCRCRQINTLKRAMNTSSTGVSSASAGTWPSSRNRLDSERSRGGQVPHPPFDGAHGPPHTVRTFPTTHAPRCPPGSALNTQYMLKLRLVLACLWNSACAR